MALRVLLADESSTIKKVIQLALQDYSVEVKTVHSGVDVLEVVRSFHPDVVFVDVLLPKRNGYEVARELKSDPGTSQIPVIMMWSSFMDFDEAAFEKSKAEARLEKPFEVSALRDLVLQAVPKAKANPVAPFLDYSTSIAGPLKYEEEKKAMQFAEAPIVQQGMARQPSTSPSATTFGPAFKTPSASPNKPQSQAKETAARPWNMDSFSQIEDFMCSDAAQGTAAENESPFKIATVSKKPAVPPTAPPTAPAGSGREDNWRRHDLSRYRVELPDETDDDIAALPQIVKNTEPSERAPSALESRSRSTDRTATSGSSRTEGHQHLSFDLHPEDERPLEIEAFEPAPKMSEEALERVIRAQSQEVIERLVQKIVPDIATQIIRRELDRLLKESESGLR